MSAKEVRVLVVEDEPSLRQLLRAVLEKAGWQVRDVATGTRALEAAESFRPHLIVLDVVLPDIGGMEVLKILRGQGCESMVLFLTANSAVGDRIAGIEAGGDDYVTKPFSIGEVVARLRGLLRRSPAFAAESDQVLRVADLTLDPRTVSVTRAGRAVALTSTEFSLLQYLMANADRVLAKADILEAVWGYDFGEDSNVVEIYISYLRKKIDVGAEPIIHTVRGAGYVLRAPVGAA